MVLILTNQAKISYFLHCNHVIPKSYDSIIQRMMILVLRVLVGVGVPLQSHSGKVTG